ncbi:MAG: hypothetical protein ABWX60_03360 [Aeromicrobium sp.]
MGLLAMGLALTVSRPSSATAATSPDQLGLSVDGTGPWTTSLTEPLFGAGARWVPGDMETGEFWARNQSQDSSELRVVVEPRLDELHAAGDLDLQIRTDSDPWRPLTTAWTSPRPIPAGAKARIQIRASLTGAATNAAQTLAFSFDVRARLNYVAGSATSPTPAPAPSTSPTDAVTERPESQTPTDAEDRDARVIAPRDSLADTGAGHPAWLLPAGVGATITGLWLALAARRRNEEESDVHE